MTQAQAEVRSEVHQPAPSAPHGETYLEHLDRAVATSPDAEFLSFAEGPITFGEVDRRSTRMANALRELGVGAGHTVCTMLDSSADAVVIWFAVNRLGAIWVPLNTAYRGEFLRHQMADSSAALVVCEEHYLPAVGMIAGDLPEVRLILTRNGQGKSNAGDIRVRSLDDHRGTDDTPIDTRPKPGDTACLIYTSGTTGASKGCIISYNYLCACARQSNDSVPPRPGDTVWTALPLFHLSGSAYVVLAALLAQSRARVMSTFSVTNFWNDIEESRATSAILMGAMFQLLAQAPDNEAMLRCRGQLRAITGVPISPADREIWSERFGVARIDSYGYGQTEATKVCYLPHGAPMPPAGSAGPVSKDFDLMISDDYGNQVATGAPGEILVRPRRPNVMFNGYWKRPEDTVRVWQNLWMHTGDLGRVDEQGYLYFVDRKKDYVRSRGENISSMEVERAFLRHPAVSEVAFHSVSVTEGGEEELKVTVVLRSGQACTEEELCRWSMDQLPHFAVPRYVEFREGFPKTPTGRVQKHILREEGHTSATWDAHAFGLVARRRQP
ncbi:Long-chain fatty acid--CoA ligase [Sphingobium herbicidovorans NBRC 16415]|uniref:Long-chain fatty acid--CoA ligase n=1 Tax=Sphingobium herbicidovorans (strain ATCC 700291 / DSM 11019 / CCUG 56400 / KCTC 2939 / LMG 18315 / NBRC 16415 / MH) TaxID=1219045 RepID=A0A086PC13_SPHHM|nr:AMP-binding protein [Sphingobium herbicidovorans]KFG90931.1 Long-chain fatty acid--CoA ligase [Sphingobium herbicidovorans NBRC 16415]